MDCARLVPEMLQEVIDLITEKELRLRTPLEELDLLIAGSEPRDQLAAVDSDLQTDDVGLSQTVKSE